MTPTLLLWWCALCACTGSMGTGGADGSGETSHTGLPGPAVARASCTRALDHALRGSCAVELDAPGATEITFTADGAPSRSFASTEEQIRHEVTVWGLLPDTAYTWRVGATAGELLTGSLPARFDAYDVDVTGQLSGMDAVLQPLSCDGSMVMVMIDEMGRIIWYEDTIYTNPMQGYDWSAEDRSVMAITNSVFEETHVSGKDGLRLSRGADFDQGVLHHDVARWRGITYLLFEYPSGALNVDGIYAFEGDTLLGTFDLADHYEIEGGQGDWAHSNGLEVGPDGQLTLSLLRFDSVIGIDGDPDSTSFLEPRWLAVGTEQSLPDPDYQAVASTAQFSGQHNASRHGDDLYLFDNRGTNFESRGLHLRMNPATQELDFVADYGMDSLCQIQGGAIPVDGGVLVTCATDAAVRFFEPGNPVASWTMSATCGQGRSGMTRGIPITVW